MKIHEIYLQTSKSDELKAFYSRIIGLETNKDAQGNIVIATEKTRIVFETAEKEDPFYHFAFNIPSNKINEAYNWLKQRVELLWLTDYKSYIADFSNWNAKSVYFIDPAGNIVELIARFDLHDNETAVFSAKQIRNVSEIGLVLPEATYENDIAAILSSYELSYFIKQPLLEKFRAIGDDEGLFVCVPENRAWYPPGDRIASLYPMKIIFEPRNKKYTYRSLYSE